MHHHLVFRVCAINKPSCTKSRNQNQYERNLFWWSAIAYEYSFPFFATILNKALKCVDRAWLRAHESIYNIPQNEEEWTSDHICICKIYEKDRNFSVLFWYSYNEKKIYEVTQFIVKWIRNFPSAGILNRKHFSCIVWPHFYWFILYQ